MNRNTAIEYITCILENHHLITDLFKLFKDKNISITISFNDRLLKLIHLQKEISQNVYPLMKDLFHSCVYTLLDLANPDKRILRQSIISDFLSLDKNLVSLINKYDYYLHGHVQLNLDEHRDCVMKLIILKDKIISSSHDKTVKMWNFNSTNSEFTIKGRTPICNIESISPTKAVSEGFYGLRIWDLQTQKLSLINDRDISVIVTLKNGNVVSAGNDRCHLRMWDPITGKLLVTSKERLECEPKVKVLPDQRILVASDCLMIWDPQSNEFTQKKRNFHDIYTMEVYGDKVITGCHDASIKVWNLNNLLSPEFILVGHTGTVSIIRILFDGRIVSGSYDKTLRIWNLETRTCEFVLVGHTNCIFALNILLNGDIISGSNDSTLKIWNPNTGMCIKTLNGHKGSIFPLEVVNDKVISACSHGVIKVWQ